jgi:predicted transcriptional regulator
MLARVKKEMARRRITKSARRELASIATTSSISGLIRWHKLFVGVFSRVAKNLALDPSYISRVASGERKSPEVINALMEEINRLDKLKPREIHPR